MLEHQLFVELVGSKKRETDPKLISKHIVSSGKEHEVLYTDRQTDAVSGTGIVLSPNNKQVSIVVRQPKNFVDINTIIPLQFASAVVSVTA